MLIVPKAFRFALATLLGVSFAWAAIPRLAEAAPEVMLRPRPVSKGAQITLADLFEGVKGPAAATAVGMAAPGGGQTVLDAAEVQTKVRVAGYEWSNAEGAARITVGSLQGPPSHIAPRSPGPAAAKRPAVLVYARNMRAGDLIRPEDLRWSTEVLSGGDGLTDPDDAIGKAARRPLREGAPGLLSDLAVRVMIHRDDIVSVSFTSEGVSLVLQAKALADANRGQVVEVVNTASKKVIEAVCSGPGQAAVGPAAEQLKASNQGALPYATAAR